jgi:TonB family protein
MSASISTGMMLAALSTLAACAPGRTAAPAPPSTEAVADSARVWTMAQVTTPPSFINVPDVARMMARNHPPVMRDASRGGTVVLLVRVGRDGIVRDTRVLRSSGDAQMDAMAVRVAGRLRARPARIGDTRVAVEVEIPFEFGIGP